MTDFEKWTYANMDSFDRVLLYLEKYYKMLEFGKEALTMEDRILLRQTLENYLSMEEAK